MPKTFSKQYFATASGDFNSVASFNFCTKCLSHFYVWQTPLQPWSTRALWLPRRSQVFVGEVRQFLAADFSCDWEIVPIQWRRKGFKCCLADPESPCLKLLLMSHPSGLGALSALGVEQFLAKFKPELQVSSPNLAYKGEIHNFKSLHKHNCGLKWLTVS